jgi:hypothetical protein
MLLMNCMLVGRELTAMKGWQASTGLTNVRRHGK